MLRALEEARKAKQIGASLEACVRIPTSDLLKRYEKELKPLFVVSQVILEPREEPREGILVEHAAGLKCERCWKYSTFVGKDPNFPTVCEDCSAALKEMLG